MQLMKDVLELVKIDSGMFPAELTATPPEAVIRGILEEMRPAAEQRGLWLDGGFDAALPELIASDPRSLRRILLRLLDNAIRFTDRGGIYVEVRTAATPSGDVLVVAVSDTGRGLSPAACTSVFEAFARMDASLARACGGAGLGLTLARSSARLLGGDIDVASVEGSGSTFTLTIPARPCAPAQGPADRWVPAILPLDEDVDPTAESLLRHVAQTLGGAHVLVVVSGREDRRRIASTLRRVGFSVSVAEDGRAGADRALAARDTDLAPDLALMEIRMPELDGREAARRLRAAGFDAPLVALGAHVAPDERERCLAAGFDDFLTPPVSRRLLVETILRNLEKSRGGLEPRGAG